MYGHGWMGWDGNYTDTCMHWGMYHIIMHNRLQIHSMGVSTYLVKLIQVVRVEAC